ncbi:unnamed protein product [Oncorhynchus mykiss]|uniref:Uncharacterized protein n=1 Tax=Oncorhynchus mykiss TaxID=8022 RepID=A0A060YW23_ONCMY|nr:unnamed protein product [Oncorhynchus mykiss]
MEKHKKITSLKFEYNQILSAKIAKSFLYAKQKYFEFGDKPQKLLARQLRKNVSDRMIHKVKSASGELLSSPKDINDRFRQFYETLYTSKADPITP